MTVSPSQRGLRLGPDEVSIVRVVVTMALVALAIGLVAFTLIDPLPEGASALEALFDPRLWRGLVLLLLGFVLVLAGAGLFGGLLVALVALVVASMASDVRRRWLVLAPGVGCAVAIVLGFLVV